MSSVVKMNINNREFEVACNVGQEEDLMRLSYELDRRIKNNAQMFGDTNTSFLFMITALQLLDEVEELKSGALGGINLNDEIGRANVGLLDEISSRIEKMTATISQKIPA